MNTKLLKSWFVLLCVMIAPLQGCAVNMAASGQDGPDINIVQKQQTRADVERMLRVSSEIVARDKNSTTELYRVTAKTDPSFARAAGHATVDLFSFGLWELVGGPLEAYKGRRQNIYVQYSEDDNVLSVRTNRNLNGADGS